MNAFTIALGLGLVLTFCSCQSLEGSESEKAPHRVVPIQSPSEAQQGLDTIEGILARAYATISGPRGEMRDWDRFLDLFLPGQGDLRAVFRDAEGQPRIRHLKPEDYKELGQRMFDQEGFFEYGLHHRIERFGSVAHVFSTYESRKDPSAEPFARGVNSFQLYWDGKRWYIVSIFWDQEYPDQIIPQRYLPRRP